ncbi:MAG TPA: polysaccharide deacetylase family protein [Pseudobacteroides sp.]|nr:polysaccharide deacetylase family protein [Pseudobacteroides sp.]
MLETDIKEKARRYINKIICLLIYYSGLYFILKKIFFKNGLYIFFYHSFVDTAKCRKDNKFISLSAVDKEAFEKQLKYFKKEYTLITMDEAYQLMVNKDKLDKRYLVITIDDGYKDNYTYGYDLFKKYHVFPTIYLTANNVDKSIYLWPDILRYIVYNSTKTHVDINIFDIHYTFDLKDKYSKFIFIEFMRENVKKYDEDKKQEILEYLSKEFNVRIQKKCDTMLSWEEVQKLSSIGVSFGAHTLNHPILANLTKAKAEDEIYGSKVLIEQKTNKKVRHFAYPNGRECDINEHCINWVRKHFDTATTTIPGINVPGDDLMKLKRIGLAYDYNIIDFKVKVLYFCILDAFKKRNNLLLKK